MLSKKTYLSIADIRKIENKNMVLFYIYHDIHLDIFYIRVFYKSKYYYLATKYNKNIPVKFITISSAYKILYKAGVRNITIVSHRAYKW